MRSLGRNFYAKASGLAPGCKFGLGECQRVYFPRFGGASVIDPVRVFMQAKGFNWRALIVPDTLNENFAARAQFEDQVSAIPGSYLVSINAFVDGTMPSDFVFTIQDKRVGGETIFSSWVRYQAGSGGALGAIVAGATSSLPFWLPSPWLVREPGLLLVKITNMATTAQNIRISLQFAEPTGSKEL